MRVRGRYFETAEWEGIPSQWWYGGGTDITPAYVYDEDMKHFHGSYKQVCDAHDPEFYHKFRKWYARPLLCMSLVLTCLCPQPF
jgi:coproporphyrinogen III oxidase